MIIKKINITFVIIASLMFFSVIYINNIMHIEVSIYRIYYAIQDRFNRKINNIPINYIKSNSLNDKIAHPAPWVISQIEKDFANFSNASVNNVVRTFDLLPEEALLVLFTIKDGALSINKKSLVMNETCEHGVLIYSRVVDYLAKRGYITNVSFLVRFTDLFSNQVLQYTAANLAPILATSKNLQRDLDKNLVLIPDYMSLEDMPIFMPRIRKAKKLYPWHKKQHKIYWRGGHADVSGFRKSIVEYSNQHPGSIIDAKFTDTKLSFVPPEFQLQSKFLLNIDGHTAAWTRPIWQLQSNSVMVKQNSALTQWYYDALIPDVHFIAVNSDPEAVIDKVNRYTDQELYNIAQGGSLFAENNLTIDDMVAYIALVLQRYEYLQNNK